MEEEYNVSIPDNNVNESQQFYEDWYKLQRNYDDCEQPAPQQRGRWEDGDINMACKCAKVTDEWHGWECTVSGGECMYLMPDSKRCAEEFGEGPDATDEA